MAEPSGSWLWENGGEGWQRCKSSSGSNMRDPLLCTKGGHVRSDEGVAHDLVFMGIRVGLVKWKQQPVSRKPGDLSSAAEAWHRHSGHRCVQSELATRSPEKRQIGCVLSLEKGRSKFQWCFMSCFIPHSSTPMSEVLSVESTKVELKSYCFFSAAVTQEGVEELWHGAKYAGFSLGDLSSQFADTHD